MASGSAFEAMHALQPGKPVQIVQQPVDRDGQPCGPPVVFTGHLKQMHADHAWGIEAEIVIDSWTPDGSDVILTQRRRSDKGKTRAKFLQDLVKEMKMEKFTATVIRNPRNRSVTVHVEDKDGKFLLADGTREERALNAEMPAYATFPEEVWNSFASATVENEVGV